MGWKEAGAKGGGGGVDCMMGYERGKREREPVIVSSGSNALCR